MIPIHERLRRCVSEKGLKQKHIADKVGISPDKLSKLLNGRVSLSADDFIRICIAIDESPDSFRPMS